MKLHHAPRTRSIRILWLLEELGVEYELESYEFAPGQKAYAQRTPLGKFPVLEDEDEAGRSIVMTES